jgi:hypothetical protein
MLAVQIRWADMFTCSMDSMRFAALAKDHSNGMPARSKAAAAQHSINTPALDSRAGRCWAVAPTAAAVAGAAVLAACCVRAMAANGNALAYTSALLVRLSSRGLQQRTVTQTIPDQPSGPRHSHEMFVTAYMR